MAAQMTESGIKYIDEFRDRGLADKLAAAICDEVQPGRQYKLMEFCGGHTHAIFRYGVQTLLPDNVELIHGPGCPVCVLPIARLDQAIDLAFEPNTILCSYGDMLRVPGSRKRSLLKAKAQGASVRMVYSAADALSLAQKQPDKRIIFFAIGFEATTPPTAVIIQQAERMGLDNFFVFCNHILTPAAMRAILDAPNQEDNAIDGIIGPAHVSTVIGSAPYAFVASEYKRPLVIAGFEPLDILQAILMLIRQLNKAEARVENEYSRAVTQQGNTKAQDLVAEIFETRDSFEWRGLGHIPHSGLKIRERYTRFDIEAQHSLPIYSAQENKACACPDILRGVKKPTDCEIFGTACTPETPIGACMVSSEGACAAYYNYGRHK